MNNWWRLRRTLRRLSRVGSAADGLLLVQALLFASLVPHLMRFPLGRVQAILEPRRPPLECDNARERRVLGLVNLALDIGRPLLHPTCLTRGVTRYYFLRRAGLDVGLVFGIGHPTQQEVAGHCWLTRHGEPFHETLDPRPLFTEVYRIGGRPMAKTAAC